MSRRILYNPVDFVEASTPFYDNLIGTITDQTDRISRNIELAREDRLRQEDRDWQEGMLNKQLDSRREMQQEQLEFQGDQYRMNRHQNEMHFLGNQSMQVENLRLNWAKLGIEQQTDTQRAADKEMQDAQTLINKLDDTYRGAGLVTSDFSVRRDIIRGPDNQMYVADVFNTDAQGNPIILGTYEDYVNRSQKMFNFVNTVLEGQNGVEWAFKNLEEGGFETPDDDMEYFDRGKFIDFLAEVQKGGLTPENVQIMESFTNMGSKVRLLRKGENDPILTLGHQYELNMRIQTGIGTLMDANNFRIIFSDDMRRFNGDDRAWFSSETTRQNVQQTMVIPFTLEYSNLPGVEFEGQTIGGMYNRYQNMRARYDGREPDEVKQIGNVVEDFRRLAMQTFQIHPEIIPAHLQGQNTYRIANAARLNKQEALKAHPSLKNLWVFPSTIEEMEVIENTMMTASQPPTEGVPNYARPPSPDSYQDSRYYNWMQRRRNN